MACFCLHLAELREGAENGVLTVKVGVSRFFSSFLRRQLMMPPLSFQNLLNIPILNVLWRIIAGHRFEYSDPELKQVLVMVGDIMSAMAPKPNLAWIFPSLREYFPSIDRVEESVDKFAPIRNYIEDIIMAHRRKFDPASINDFIDAYLAEIQVNQLNFSSFCEK